MPAPRKEPQKPLDPLSVAVGRRVVELRAGRGMQAPDLAARAGMDPNYLWRIEEGRQNLSLRNVARLAKALDVTLSAFFEGIAADVVELESRPYGKRSDGAD